MAIAVIIWGRLIFKSSDVEIICRSGMIARDAPFRASPLTGGRKPHEGSAMIWDEDAPKPRPAYELGKDLSAFSVEELQDYIAVLMAERDRAETMLASKKASRNAAQSVFKG
jgi:uncharacterized small protein (DUF1192 family)